MSDATSKSTAKLPPLRPAAGPGRWQDVELLAYKQDAEAPFRDVTRQVLFADSKLGCEWRYFEVGAGGHSTLERHGHVHAVMIHRGRGQCLVGDQVSDVGVGDLVFIPSHSWHQFRANAGEPLGFLCLVNAARDRPQLPDAEQLSQLRANPAIARFLDS